MIACSNSLPSLLFYICLLFQHPFRDTQPAFNLLLSERKTNARSVVSAQVLSARVHPPESVCRYVPERRYPLLSIGRSPILF